MLMPLYLSIIIPAYNEENRVGRGLDDLLPFLEAQTYKVEVIVVDDGSSDETANRVKERIAEFQAAGHQLRLLTNNPNRGKGYSVKRGLTEANGEIVLFSDVDPTRPGVAVAKSRGTQ